MLLQHLNSEENEKLKKLWDADYQTIVSGKDNGVPYLKYLFELHFKLFGETCSHCTSKYAGYIKNIKNLNPKKIMSKKVITLGAFRLNEMTTIPVRGTSIAYSNANLTDEIAIELLAANPNRKILFAKLPEDVDAQIEAYKKSLLEPAKETETKAIGVVVGDKVLTVEQATSLLTKINKTTKATTIEGLTKFYKNLSDDERAELYGLAKEIKDEVPACDETTSAEETSEDAAERTKEDIEFDLAKAEQDLEDLSTNEPDNAEAIANAQAVVEKFKNELEALA
jgi:hypothetical protein